MSKKALLIVFEGIDKTGKTTHAKNLRLSLNTKNIKT
jgi:thymidylate kinase